MTYNATMKRASAFSITCLLFAALTHAAAQTPAPNGVLSPVWSEAFRYLAEKNETPDFHLNVQPYNIQEAEAILLNIRRSAADPLDRRLARQLLDDLPNSSPGATLNARAGISQNALPYLNGAFHLLHPKGAELILEARVFPAGDRKDPLPGASTAQFRTRPWNPFDAFPDDGYSADFTRAALSAHISGINISLGRMPFRWGPGMRAALLLSDDSPSLDGIFINGAFGQIKGCAVFAYLNRIWSGAGTERYLARRYFSARRLNWKPSPSLEIGLSDAVVYGGDLRAPEIHYLNPILPLYASQFNAAKDASHADLDDNVMASLDVQWKPAKRHALHAEILIDDLRYDPKSNDPQAFAWLVGWRRAAQNDAGEWSLEYSRVRRFTYTHLKQENRYTHYSRSLGHFLGNDADLLHASYARFLSPNIRASFAVEQRRKGDSTVNDRYRGETDISFLKGTAKTTRAAELRVWARRQNWLARCGLSVQFTRGQTRPSIEWTGSIERAFR